MNQMKKKVTLIRNEAGYELATKERETLEVLRRRGGEMWAAELKQIANASSSTLAALEQKKFVAIESIDQS